MSKKIIICADGTWNTEDQVDHGTSDPTNVVKIARALLPLDDQGMDQIIYYHSGVGTNFNQHFGGGAFGAGLFANIQDCYRFLIHNYVPGDRLYFFGFSRGAYTVRSLAGLVRNSGILRRGHEDQQETAFLNYQNRSAQTTPDSPQMQQFRQEHSYTLPGDTGQAIEMIGVWDTVGALGVPANVLGLHLPGSENCQFHDVTLSSYVKSAFHALAIHEHRKEFLANALGAIREWQSKRAASRTGLVYRGTQRRGRRLRSSGSFQPVTALDDWSRQNLRAGL